MMQDLPMLTQVSGVGPKAAQRLIHELKDKIPESEFVVQGISDVEESNNSDPRMIADVLSALTNLGYTASQAQSAVRKVREKFVPETNMQDIIRYALKELSK